MSGMEPLGGYAYAEWYGETLLISGPGEQLPERFVVELTRGQAEKLVEIIQRGHSAPETEEL